MKTLFGFAILCLVSASVFAQPRADDRFLAKKVELLLPLSDKINEPMASAESQLYLPSENVRKGHFVHTRGLVNALLAGFEQGDYPAYQPENLRKEICFAELKYELKKRADDFNENDDKNSPNAAQAITQPGISKKCGDALPQPDNTNYKALFFPLNAAVKIIGDEIFDKNTSNARFIIQYIELYYIDPAGVLPDKPVAAFKYDEIKYVLDHTQWTNRFNDAEHRTLKEIFELRLYSAYLTNVSDVPMMTLDESRLRIEQIREMEHHLWEY